MKNHARLFLICATIMLALLTISGYAKQQHVQQQEDKSYEKTSDTFFKMLQQGQGAEAVDYLFANNPSMKKPDNIQQLRSGFASLVPLMGPYISRTKLAETKVAGMFVYQHYFVAYERQPISIRVKYYKPGSTWLCYAVQFDTDLDNLIQKQTDDRLPVDVK
ncbi:MAG: hypothetical protein WBV36_14975 [Terriglobales bacterium]|jgi:hypothetical protein